MDDDERLPKKYQFFHYTLRKRIVFFLQKLSVAQNMW